MVLSVADATLPDVVATESRSEQFKELDRRKRDQAADRTEKREESVAAARNKSRFKVRYNTHDEFKRRWWLNPNGLTKAQWENGDLIGEGDFGSVRKLKLIIAGTEYAFAVKELTDTRGFTQQLPTFNQNLETCADVMPVFECGGLEPLPPVYHTVGTRTVGYMGLWDSADPHIMDSCDQPAAERAKICRGLEKLRADCARHDIALPDFKPKNIGYRSVGAEYEYRLLDLDSIVFMDTCFVTNPGTPYQALVHTHIGPRFEVLLKEFSAGVYKRGTKYYRTNGLLNGCKDQLVYLTTAQFFLCIASIAAMSPMGWTAYWEDEEKSEPGDILRKIRIKCAEWTVHALEAVESDDPQTGRIINSLAEKCTAQADKAKAAIPYCALKLLDGGNSVQLINLSLLQNMD